MEDALLSGEGTFSMKVPYSLISVGKEEPKPLVVYLHGYKQNTSDFRQQVSSLLSIEAYHLFVQGPYPVYDRHKKEKVEDWGRAWYVYDGDQKQFAHSLEQTSKFLDRILASVEREVEISGTAMLGYSMGGYLAGYFALSRYNRIDDLAVIGSRIKTELFAGDKPSFSELNVLALHGHNDKSVKSLPQKKSCRQLAAWGANVHFKELKEGHRLTGGYISEAKEWFFNAGYG
jgi:predicted esterase